MPRSAGRATERVRRHQKERQREMRFREGQMDSRPQAMIGIDSPGGHRLHSADCLRKGQTTLCRIGHGTSADIVLCLPPAPKNWG
ncbi:hypothetical protein PBY51_001931 [Eleginops maclovinus]|uniref:Uncharacterized protein n=1 Tax=Eleginops maclovinus TaxID=56733 RepID=A0AAN8ADJ5_ELEMC|nr:hypothetical protein PBY51_001931 [Eleginops maclovinus]